MATMLINDSINHYDKLHNNFDKFQNTSEVEIEEKQIKPIEIDVKKINQIINDFVINKNEPISIEDISVLKTFAQSLHPYYFVKECNDGYKYELTIEQNKADNYNILPIYILDVTTYCNKKMLLHIKFDNLEYTQYQITDYVIQLYKLQNHTKIYNTKINKYHVISKEDNFKRMIEYLNEDDPDDFFEDSSDGCDDLHNNNFCDSWDKNDSYDDSYDDLHNSDLCSNSQKNHSCHDSDNDDHENDNHDNDHDNASHNEIRRRIYNCVGLMPRNKNCPKVKYVKPDENNDRFDVIDVIEKLIYDTFNEKCHFTSNAKDINMDEFTMNYTINPINEILILNSTHYKILIKKMTDTLRYYDLKISYENHSTVNYEIISDDLIQNVLQNILNLDILDNNTNNDITNTFCTIDISLNDFHYMKSQYFKIETVIFNETFIRKQINHNGKVIFDGICNLIQNSQMLIDTCRDNVGESKVNKFTPYDSSTNKSTVLINKVKENINKLGLDLPDFLIDNQNDLIKQYIMKKYSNFDVKRLQKQDKVYNLTTFRYNKQNKLISKVNRSFDLETTMTNDAKIPKEMNIMTDGVVSTNNMHIEQEIYDPTNNMIISKFTETIKSTNNIVNEITSHIYVICDNYKVEYNKYLVHEKQIRAYDKKIYKNNNLIYDGHIKDNDVVVDLNVMNKEDQIKFNFNDILNHNFISNFGINLNTLHKNEDENNMYIFDQCQQETFSTNDNKYKFEFNYNYYPKYLMHTYGNSSSTAKSIVVTKSENGKDNINSIDQHNFDSDGQQKNSKFIDESNRLTIKALTMEEINAGRIGYKAAQTSDNKMCIIKLFLPKDAKVAWDQYKDKYRTNKVIVLSIKKIYYEKKHHYYTKDLNLEDCGVCLDAPSTFIAYPCRHKLCGTCWKQLIDVSQNKNCPTCRAHINKIEEVPINKLPENSNIDENEEIIEAYSCVHTDQFIYKKNEQIIIDDFDGNLKKVCAPGIHFHDKEEDVFQWFEYMNIPENVLIDDMPWIDDYSKSYTNERDILEKKEKREKKYIKDIIEKDKVTDSSFSFGKLFDDIEEYVVSKGRTDKPGKKKKNEPINDTDDHKDIEFED